jgi:hypothetical protein
VDEQNNLIYASSLNDPETEEYWVSLTEKAYAKLHACYQALNYGLIDEAL